MEGFGKGITRKIIISGASSSSGKTSVACGLLEAFRYRKLKVCAYKTGCDYIDTEYLRRAGNCEAYNLDTWLVDKNSVRELFINTSNGKDIAVIEGVMGLYDGGANSTAEISKLLSAPVILVINSKSLGESAAAIASGFKNYDRDINFAGVILNFTGSETHEKIIADELKKAGIKFLGALRRNKNFKIPERHLGLLPFTENRAFDFDDLRIEAEKGLDIDEILKISECGEILKPRKKFFAPPKSDSKIKISVAKDEAFSFYYPESLETLKNYGAELNFFSPLHDRKLPDSDCYIFGGGFPENFASELSENFSMLESVRSCCEKQTKILAECGGLMYLCRSLKNLNGEKFDMAGLIPFDSFMTERPVIGYIEAMALRENILCGQDEKIRGHEFHYSRVEPDFEFYDDNCAFEFVRRRTGDKYFGGYSDGKILASYLHINFYGNPELAKKLLLYN